MKYFVKSSLSENIHETPEGFLLCIGVPIARTGEMVYGEGETPLETDEEGKILIQREEEEVFRPATIASFEGKPVTIGHPNDFVNPSNWKNLAKGAIQNVRRGTGEHKDDLLADVLLNDLTAIGLVKNGLREVSCGYEAEYEQMGEGRGIQKRIVGNHLALVDQGRAGSAYKINDHKGKGFIMEKLIEKLKKRFGAKVIDEAMAEKDDAKDEGADPAKKDDAKAADAPAWDELKKMMDAMGAKLDSFMKGKDAGSEQDPQTGEPAKIDAKDDDVASGLEDRLKAVEAGLAKLLENQAAAGDESDVITDDAEEDDGDESEDEAEEDPAATGDEASRIEILAPGKKFAGKDAKEKALKVFFETADGKKVLETLTGAKKLTLDSAEKTNMLFTAASELLKSSRSSELANTKKGKAGDSVSEGVKGAPTADELNEINAKHYNLK